MRTGSRDPDPSEVEGATGEEAAPRSPSASAEDGRAPKGSEAGGGIRLWPVLIVLGMTLVILVNGLFIYIAVKGADEVVPSYNTEER